MNPLHELLLFSRFHVWINQHRINNGAEQYNSSTDEPNSTEL